MSVRVSGYRMQFTPSTGKGDIVLYLVSSEGTPKTALLNGLAAETFNAMAVMLTTDKDHRLLWDGTKLDAGPEET